MLSPDEALRRLNGWKQQGTDLSIEALSPEGTPVRVGIGRVAEIGDELVLATPEGTEMVRVPLEKVTFTDGQNENVPHFANIPSTSVLVIRFPDEKSQLRLVEFSALMADDRGDDWTPEVAD